MRGSLLSSVFLFFYRVSYAQQFQDYVFPYEDYALSATCFAAVNSTVSSCPGWLASFTGIEDASFPLLGQGELDALCGSACRTDLSSLKRTVTGACTAETDVMVPNGIAYPATFLVDRFLYAASLSCLKDSASGEYCDIIVAPWMNQTEPYSRAQNCSECELRIQAVQLGSPFGYDEDSALDYAFSSSSCGSSEYAYTTPTLYALNSTTAPPPRPTCTTGRTHVVQEEDSCNSIAESQGVATEALISINGLNLGCNLMPPAGTALCLPESCRIVQLGVEDTCESIIAAENITLSQFLAWNPSISPGCANLASWRGRFVCASSPIGTITVPDGDSATTVAPAPTNAQGGSHSRCGKWYTIAADDSCASLSLAFTLSLTDFYFLNPQVNSTTCSNLWLGYAYCVKAVGNIETYSGYPVEVPSTVFPRPPPPTTTPLPAFDPPPLQSRAPGTLDDCDNYENAWPADITFINPDANACDSWANFADVRVVQLRRWNPSLTEENCVFLQDYSYCIRKEDDMNDPSTPAPIPSTTVETPPTSTTAGSGPSPPAETQPGTIDSCKKWHVVSSGDSCWSITNENDITLDDFYRWNPGVGTGCEALWLGYAVCVGT